MRYRISLEVLFVRSHGDLPVYMAMGIIFPPNDTIEQWHLFFVDGTEALFHRFVGKSGYRLMEKVALPSLIGVSKNKTLWIHLVCNQ